MIVQGSINPQKIWIKYIDENNNAIVKLTRNVNEKDINNILNIPSHIYEYEEIEMSIQNRYSLEQYIETNFDLLFEKGLSDYELKKQLEEKEKQINDLINNYTLLEVNQQTQDLINSLQELADIYGDTMDSIMFTILPNIKQ